MVVPRLERSALEKAPGLKGSNGGGSDNKRTIAA